MTSSLVGSEMCIRDSYSCMRRNRIGTLNQNPGSSIWYSAKCGSCALWPVSYTHLTLPTICSV
eukprot:56576-Prorocentrum_lima.AAC.1